MGFVVKKEIVDGLEISTVFCRDILAKDGRVISPGFYETMVFGTGADEAPFWRCDYYSAALEQHEMVKKIYSEGRRPDKERSD